MRFFGKKSLFQLLNLNPDIAEERSKYDDRAVIEEVRRNPKDAKRIYEITAYIKYGKLYPLWMAVMLGGSLEAVEALYEANPDAVKHKNRYGSTVLHFACLFNQSFEVTTFLVKQHPSAVEMKTDFGWTPLHYACYKGGALLNVMGMLLDDCPSALHMRTNFGDTPLILAKRWKASQEVISLLEDKAEATAASPSSVRPPLIIPATAALASTTTPSGDFQENVAGFPKATSSPRDMFAPPKHLIHQNGEFERALAAAREGNRWLLVNLQCESDFSCHALNRDVWGDETVQNLIRSKLIFWQTTDVSQDGQLYVERYNVKAYPHVAIMEPHTKRPMWQREGWAQSDPMTARMFVEAANDFFSHHSDEPSTPRHDETESEVGTNTAKQSSQHANPRASEFSPEVISGLTDMGSDKETVVQCLRRADGNREAAVDLLVNEVDHTDPNSAQPVRQASPSAEDDDLSPFSPSELAAVKGLSTNLRDFHEYFASTGMNTAEDQKTISFISANLKDIDRALESVRGLPGTLDSKPDHVKIYFRIFTSAFERIYVASQALATGAVKGQLMSSKRQFTACVLEALGSITSGSNIPFLGFIAIFTSLGTHMLQQKETNMLYVFQDFFSGQSRDGYLSTYRTAAEQICLHPDCLSSFDGGDDASPDVVGPLRTKVKQAVERVQKRLQRCHLQAINDLQPIELKAMDDLLTITDCVLNLWMDNRDEYEALKEGSNKEKSDFVLKVLSIDCSVSREAASPVGLSSEAEFVEHPTLPHHSESIGQSDAETIRQLQEKVQHLEKQAWQNRDEQKRQNQHLQRLEKQNKDLERQVALHLGDGSTDVDVGGRGAQQMCLHSKQSTQKARTASGQRGETTGGFDANEVMEKVCGLEHKLGEVTDDMEKTRFYAFVANRVMTVVEAKRLVQGILSRSSDDLQVKGRFSLIKPHSSIDVDSKDSFALDGKTYQIGKFHRSSSLWKRDSWIKIDQDHNDAKSVKSWFEENSLGFRFELHSKAVILEMFAKELKYM